MTSICQKNASHHHMLEQKNEENNLRLAVSFIWKRLVAQSTFLTSTDSCVAHHHATIQFVQVQLLQDQCWE